jgi:hypothetical protein
MNNYLKFAIMMATSFVIMYAVMFTNVDQLDHIMLSTTRTYMTILMIAPMAIMMLLFMKGMYTKKTLNYFLLTLMLVIGSSAYYMLRQQVLVDDVAYMKAMIPHHSSAIMVSQKAHFSDPETKQLAKDIIEAQKREIAQMEKIIQRLEQDH